MKTLLRVGLLLVLATCTFSTFASAQNPLSVLTGGLGATTESPAEAPAEPTVEDATQALIKVLEDPDQRQALIDQLGQLSTPKETTNGSDASTQTAPNSPTAGSDSSPAAGDGSTPDSTSAAESTQDESGEGLEPESFAYWLSNYTRALADNFIDVFKRVQQTFQGLIFLVDGTVDVSLSKASGPLWDVFVVLIAAYSGYTAIRAFERLFLTSRIAAARDHKWTQRLGLGILVLLYDCFCLAVGAGAGQSAGYFMGSQTAGVHDLSLFESLAVNAFVIVGALRIGLRVLLAPNRSALRVVPLEDEPAYDLYRRLGFIAIFAGFGLLLAVPFANRTISFLLGNGVRFFVVAATVVLVIRLVARSREDVEQAILRHSENSNSQLVQGLFEQFASVWHIFSYLYILLVSLIWISRPFDAVAIVLNSTLMTLIAVFVGGALSALLGRISRRGVTLPHGLKAGLPMLEHRLNIFVPRILGFLRLLISLATLLVLLDVWGMFDFGDWLFSEGGLGALESYGSAFVVLLISFMIWLSVMSWVDFRLRERRGYVVTARVRTLFQLFQNAFTVIVLVMAALLMLSEIGINIGPLIAGAGVVGLAISFGAQTLVKDIITGAFIQIENALNEGDVVTVAGVTGVVERLTVRSVRLRDLDGTTHVVPFSSVDMVSNFMRDYSYHVAVIGVSYDTDIKVAKLALEEAFNRLRDTEYGQYIIGELEVHGVTSFGASAIDIRVRIKTTPGDQWGTGRAYNEFIKEVFDEQEIEIPFPHITYQPSKTKERPAWTKVEDTPEDKKKDDHFQTVRDTEMPDSDGD
ncbi:MAG: mechanosensitive ion channel [Rhodobacteraceae bacterium]|nr:mechanosensitive ion channel [Paracoccaceae bacterium]